MIRFFLCLPLLLLLLLLELPWAGTENNNNSNYSNYSGNNNMETKLRSQKVEMKWKKRGYAEQASPSVTLSMYLYLYLYLYLCVCVSIAPLLRLCCRCCCCRRRCLLAVCYCFWHLLNDRLLKNSIYPIAAVRSERFTKSKLDAQPSIRRIRSRHSLNDSHAYGEWQISAIVGFDNKRAINRKKTKTTTERVFKFKIKSIQFRRLFVCVLFKANFSLWIIV